MTKKTKFFVLPSNKSCREMKSFLDEQQVDYDTVHMLKDGISWEDFKDILSKTEDGVDEILSTRSNPYKRLKEDGVDIDSLTLKEIYEIVQRNQRILRAPIVLTDKLVAIGYTLDEVGVLTPRHIRKSQIAGFLDTERNRVLPYIKNGNEAKYY